MIARSVVIPQRPPQIIYVQPAPVAHGGGVGCLPLILVGAMLLVPAAGGASVAHVRIVRRSLRRAGAAGVIVCGGAAGCPRRRRALPGHRGTPLPDLIPALTGERISTADAVVRLLGAVRTSAAGEAAGRRDDRITALVATRIHDGSRREVVLRRPVASSLPCSLPTCCGWRAGTRHHPGAQPRGVVRTMDRGAS
jgi:hypothetical protein